jgi:FkbM family methyltransferase
MTLLHRLRRFARRMGLEVQRAGETSHARIAGFLVRWGVTDVIDVGANIGQYGGHLRRFGYEGRIHSFEPLPDAYRSLERAAVDDPDWSAERLALGPAEGTICLNVAGNVAAASSSVLPMLERHRQAQPDAAYVGVLEVPMRRLDSIWEGLVPDDAVPFIKVDVQGFEAAVLEGAAESVRRATGLQLEMSLARLYEGAPSMRELIELTDDLGMRMVYAMPGFADPQTGELLQLDGVFFRPEAAPGGSGQR